MRRNTARVSDYLSTQNYPATSLNVLDLGCGTGLIGDVLKPYARVLTGVDLSRPMLDQADAKQLYHHLHQTGITDFLRSSAGQYDLITCMDTLIYLGRLDEVCALIHQNLKIGGQLLFSTEKLTELPDYRLNISGRYSHHQDYLTTILNDTGFNILQVSDVTIRTEAGFPIEGQFICAAREA